MIGAVQYGALNAQLKTRAASLPTTRQYQALLDAPSATAAAALLKDCGVPVPEDGARVSRSWLIARWLVPDYVTVVRRTTGRGRDLVRCLLIRHELENVKYAVRMIASGAQVDPAQILDLGELATVKAETWGRIQGWSDLQTVLARTVFAGPLGRAPGRLEELGARVALETDLDRTVYARLWRATRAFRGPGAGPIARVLGDLVDAVSLLWRVRYQQSYGLTPEAAQGWAVAAPSLGRRWTHRQREERLAESLRVQVSATPSGGSSPTADLLSDWETSLWRSLNRAARCLLHGAPLAFSAAIGFLLEKEQAIRDVTWICEGAALGLSRATLKRRLIHAVE